MSESTPPSKGGCPCLTGDYLVLDVAKIADLIAAAAASPNWVTIIACVVTSVAGCLAAPSMDVRKAIAEVLSKLPKT